MPDSPGFSGKNLKSLILLRLTYHESGDQTPSKRWVETGSQGLRSSPHPRLISLPLNPMNLSHY
jgi:hypothetical protein